MRYIVIGTSQDGSSQARAGYLPVESTHPELAASEARKQGWEVYRVFDAEDIENMWSDVQPVDVETLFEEAAFDKEIG